ncbi:hypothetical protein KQX64_06950 [Rhodopseudomonas palustris]|nr:hypothetical protein KQX64_06950 [Rhodopseudomonas palustris]
MTRAGWELGRNASRDFCPQCMADIRKRKRGADSRKGAEMAKDQEPSKTTAAATAAPEPRALGIDEALVIAEKLGEVYVGKDKGYSDGWSDKRLAEDLNVPRDWVRQIREKRFGPAGDSEEARALLAEARVASADAALMVRAVAEKLDRLGAIKGQIATLANEAQTISADVDKRFRDQMAECSRTIGRVERSIANIEKVFV